jgi:hypothetical protein
MNIFTIVGNGEYKVESDRGFCFSGDRAEFRQFIISGRMSVFEMFQSPFHPDPVPAICILDKLVEDSFKIPMLVPGMNYRRSGEPRKKGRSVD